MTRNILTILMFLVVSLFFWEGLSLSYSNTPIGYKNITAPEVKMMLDKKGAMVIHVLSQMEYDIQHIPGTINIPLEEMETTKWLPEDKNAPVILYCMGLG